MKYITLIITTILMLNSQAFAQEFKSLKSIVANDPATTYPLVRCGAMYQAIMERIGYERLGEETWALNDEIRTSLLLFSSLLLKKELPTTSIEEISEITANDARRIADIYIHKNLMWQHNLLEILKVPVVKWKSIKNITVLSI